MYARKKKKTSVTRNDGGGEQYPGIVATLNVTFNVAWVVT